MDVVLAVGGNQHSSRVYRRHEVIEERALEVKSGKLVSADVNVPEAVQIRHDNLVNTDTTEVRPWAGRRYTIAIRADPRAGPQCRRAVAPRAVRCRILARHQR